MEANEFYVGQRLVVPERHREEWSSCDDYVTVTSLHETLPIAHYSLKLNDPIGGVLHSGMYFKEAEQYRL